MTDINIPGPGSALAIAIGITLYSSAFAKDISDLFRLFLFLMVVFLSIVLYKIEELHTEKEINIALINKKGKNDDILTNDQKGKKPFGEFKFPQKKENVFVILLAAITIGIGYFGNLFANYHYQELVNKFPFYWGFYGTFVLFIGFLISILYLAHLIYPKNK